MSSQGVVCLWRSGTLLLPFTGHKLQWQDVTLHHCECECVCMCVNNNCKCNDTGTTNTSHGAWQWGVTQPCCPSATASIHLRSKNTRMSTQSVRLNAKPSSGPSCDMAKIWNHNIFQVIELMTACIQEIFNTNYDWKVSLVCPLRFLVHHERLKD